MSKRDKSLYIIFAFFLILILWTNIKALFYNCANALDFSIYQQAIFNILEGDFNPYITTRNINIFNDHFDPVLFFASAFTGIFGQGFVQLLVFEWLFFFATVMLVIRYLKMESIEDKMILLYLVPVIFSKFLLNAYLYPIHPTTWASVFLFLLTFFLVTKKDHYLYFLIPFICFFKESYAFALLPLCFYFFFMKNKKLAGYILMISIAFICFEFFGREALLGEIHDHGGKFIKRLKANPFLFIVDVIIDLNYKAFLKSFAPYLLFFFFILKKSEERAPFLKAALPTLFYLAPLLFLQMFQNIINFQYGSQFGAIFLGIILGTKAFHKLTRKQTFAVVALFLLTSMGTYTKTIKFVFLDKTKKCVVKNDKISESQLIKSKLNDSQTILATGGAIPYMTKPKLNIYHYNGWSKKLDQYDVLILEKNHSGDIYPATREDVLGVYRRCQTMASEVYVDSQYYYAAAGDFNNCVFPK